MVSAGTLRFLMTPAEAWMRLVARLCGGRAVVVAESQQTARLAITLDADRTMLHIQLGGEEIAVDRNAVETITAAFERARDEMRGRATP